MSLYKAGEIVKDFRGQMVLVVSDTKQNGYTTVQRYNHWSKWQYPTILPKRG